jgi:predicted dehydrogenase
MADDSRAAARPLGVAVAGFGWMGRVHTQAYARLAHQFPQLPLRPTLVAVADELPGRAEQAAAQFGFATASTDWRDLAADPRVQAVSVPRRTSCTARSAPVSPPPANTSGSRSRSA